MQSVPPVNTMYQQMPPNQNNQMQAAYNQQMGYQNPIQSGAVTSMTNTSQQIWRIKMADKGLFFTKLGALLLTVITLGIGKPWGDTMVIKKWASNLNIDGKRVMYNGTAIELFGIWIKVLILTLITLGIYYLFWGRYAIDRYIDSRLLWA